MKERYLLGRFWNQSLDGVLKRFDLVNGNGNPFFGRLFFLIFVKIPLANVEILGASVFAYVDIDCLASGLFMNCNALFQGPVPPMPLEIFGVFINLDSRAYY